MTVQVSSGDIEGEGRRGLHGWSPGVARARPGGRPRRSRDPRRRRLAAGGRGRRAGRRPPAHLGGPRRRPRRREQLARSARVGGVGSFGELDSGGHAHADAGRAQSEITSWSAGPVRLPGGAAGDWCARATPAPPGCFRAGGRTHMFWGPWQVVIRGHRRPRRAAGAVALGGVPQLDHQWPGGRSRAAATKARQAAGNGVTPGGASELRLGASERWGRGGSELRLGGATERFSWAPASCGWAAPASRRSWAPASGWPAGPASGAGRRQRVALPGRQRAPPVGASERRLGGASERQLRGRQRAAAGRRQRALPGRPASTGCGRQRQRQPRPPAPAPRLARPRRPRTSPR